MGEVKHIWLSDWHATRLHAVSPEEMALESSAKRPICGSGFVYEAVANKWAMKRIKKGVAKCKHCERMISNPDTVDIYEGPGPYHTCPHCQGQNITRSFNRCIDCDVKLRWRKK